MKRTATISVRRLCPWGHEHDVEVQVEGDVTESAVNCPSRFPTGAVAFPGDAPDVEIESAVEPHGAASLADLTAEERGEAEAALIEAHDEESADEYRIESMLDAERFEDGQD